MGAQGEGTPAGTGDGPGSAEAGAESTIERRLSADEARLGRDEARLAADEVRLAEDETWIRRGWFLGLALGVLLLLTITALVLAIVALNRDIEAVAKAEPKDGSVGTAALQDGAVTRAKITAGAIGAEQIADGSVAPRALATGAVRERALAAGAVTGAALADGAVTGRAVDEASLGEVPRAKTAGTADDAAALGGIAAAGYLRGVRVIEASTATSTLAAKGPVTAVCPNGTQVISGGASVDGARRVAITTSTPDGRTGWTAEATAIGTTTGPWRLVVTAVCATGG